jgi:hypothetical protein
MASKSTLSSAWLLYPAIIAFAVMVPAPVNAGNRAECDGLSEAAITREAIAAEIADAPDSLGSEKHIAACTAALRDKKLPEISPRRISLLTAKLLSAVMAGRDLGEDQLLVDRAFLRLTLEGARIKLSPPPTEAILLNLRKNILGPEGMTEAEIIRFEHLSRMISLLTLNRKSEPDQAAIDTLLTQSANALGPFDLDGFRDLAEVASMTPAVSDADNEIYRKYANLHPRGYLEWISAMNMAGRTREAFNMANAFSPPYFETDPVAPGTPKESPDAAKPSSAAEEPEDYAGQMLRIRTTALASDIIVSLNPSTPDERRQWTDRMLRYAGLLFKAVDKDKLNPLPLWDQLPVSEALIEAAAPFNLIDAASAYNQSRYADAQAALKKSQICDILDQKICYTRGRAEIAARLLKQDFPGKDIPVLTNAVEAMKNPALHRRLYSQFFDIRNAAIKALFVSPISRNAGSASLSGSVTGLERGAETGRAVAPLVYTVIVPRNGQKDADLLQRLWRIAGLVAQKNDKADIALPAWFGSEDHQDYVLRPFFGQLPTKNPYVIARFVLLNVNEQPDSKRAGARAISHTLADIAKLGPADTEEQDLAAQAVFDNAAK